jgi:hypothetical protein
MRLPVAPSCGMSIVKVMTFPDTERFESRGFLLFFFILTGRPRTQRWNAFNSGYGVFYQTSKTKPGETFSGVVCYIW